MSKTKEQLLASAEEIRTNTAPNSNTADLVGSTLKDMINKSSDDKDELQNNIDELSEGSSEVISSVRSDLSSEVARAKAAENAAAAAVTAEETRAKAAESALNTSLTGVKSDMNTLSLVNDGVKYAGLIGIDDDTNKYAANAVPTDKRKVGLIITYLDKNGNPQTYQFTGSNISQWLTITNWQGIDDVPTAGSDNLVKSGGVQEELALGAVYDVSAKNPTAGVNNDGKFESLSALLGDTNLNTLIPTSVRKGGMSIKFVQSSDNRYVQFRCKTQSFSLNVSDWESEEADIKSVKNTLSDFEKLVYTDNNFINFHNLDLSELYNVAEVVALGNKTLNVKGRSSVPAYSVAYIPIVIPTTGYYRYRFTFTTSSNSNNLRFYASNKTDLLASIVSDNEVVGSFEQGIVYIRFTFAEIASTFSITNAFFLKDGDVENDIPDSYVEMMNKKMLSDTFNVSTLYGKNTLVINSGKLYKLPNGHAENTAWGDIEKEETKAGNEITLLGEQILDLNSSIFFSNNLIDYFNMNLEELRNIATIVSLANDKMYIKGKSNVPTYSVAYIPFTVPTTSLYKLKFVFTTTSSNQNIRIYTSDKSSILANITSNNEVTQNLEQGIYYLRFTFAEVGTYYDITASKIVKADETTKGLTGSFVKMVNSAARSEWYKGKKVVTYGDSITAMYLWQPYVGAFFGASMVNKGIGGTNIAYSQYYTDEFCNDTRLAGIDEDANMVLIMGGTNDCGHDMPLGDVTYGNDGFDKSTFKGAIAYIIKKLTEIRPNAKLIFATQVGGRGKNNSTSGNETEIYVNGLGLTPLDYSNAMIEVCQHFSIPCIDIFGTSGISIFNKDTYLSDNVHPNAAGGKLLASAMIDGMVRYEPHTFD